MPATFTLPPKTAAASPPVGVTPCPPDEDAVTPDDAVTSWVPPMAAPVAKSFRATVEPPVTCDDESETAFAADPPPVLLVSMYAVHRPGVAHDVGDHADAPFALRARTWAQTSTPVVSPVRVCEVPDSVIGWAVLPSIASS